MKRNALTSRQLDAVRATTKATQLTDGQGLYLKLQWDGTVPSGNGHQWRFDYTRPAGTKAVARDGTSAAGKRNTLSFGAYPTVGLALARERAQAARTAVAEGTDPGEVKEAAVASLKAAEVALVVATERAAEGFAPHGSLLGVAQDYHAGKVATHEWAAGHAEQWLGVITRFVPLDIAHAPIGELDGPTLLLRVLQPVEQARKFATAGILRKFLAELYRHAEFANLCKGNPAEACRDRMARRAAVEAKGNNPAVTSAPELARLVRSVRAYPGSVETRTALLLQCMLFQRPGTTCDMRWADVDLDAATWTVPYGKRTKLHKSLKGMACVVPLPRQAVALLRELHELTGTAVHVFDSSKKPGQPITRGTLKNALALLGFDGKQTAHGFRATARTMLRTALKIDREVIEAQLTHVTGENNGTAYDRTLEEHTRDTTQRVAMLQAWADYLDQLAAPQLKLAA